MATARGRERPLDLCSGPGKLAQALSSTAPSTAPTSCGGRRSGSRRAHRCPGISWGPPSAWACGSASTVAWRFFVAGDPFVSRGRPGPPTGSRPRGSRRRRRVLGDRDPHRARLRGVGARGGTLVDHGARRLRRDRHPHVDVEAGFLEGERGRCLVEPDHRRHGHRLHGGRRGAHLGRLGAFDELQRVDVLGQRVGVRQAVRRLRDVDRDREVAHVGRGERASRQVRPPPSA